MKLITLFADRTGLEPATSAVTGRHSNQLNYRSKFLRTNPEIFRFHRNHRDLENLMLLRRIDFLRLNYRSFKQLKQLFLRTAKIRVLGF